MEVDMEGDVIGLAGVGERAPDDTRMRCGRGLNRNKSKILLL